MENKHPKEELLPEEIWIEPKPATWGAMLFSVTDPNNTTAVKYVRAATVPQGDDEHIIALKEANIMASEMLEILNKMNQPTPAPVPQTNSVTVSDLCKISEHVDLKEQDKAMQKINQLIANLQSVPQTDGKENQ